MKKYITRYGIADAHGIESYVLDSTEEPKPKFPNSLVFSIRAECNRQRHAVYYRAVVDVKTDDKINKLIRKRKFIEALKVLKEKAKEVSFPERYSDFYTKSWKMIPNSSLDPYHI